MASPSVSASERAGSVGAAGRRRIVTGRLTDRAAVYGVLGFVGLLFVSPFYWALIASFKTPAEARAIPPTWLPRTLTLESYALVLNWEFARYFLNSFVYATSLTVLIALTSSAIAFTVVKLPSRAGDMLFALIVGSMMVPFVTYIVPLYGQLLNVQRALGVPMVNTYWGMILPEMISPFGVFLLRQAILSIPGELLDAARIDGASTFRIYRSIVLPLINANIAALAVFTFMFRYNELLWPLVVAQKQQMFPIAVGLLVYVGEFWTDYSKFNAAAITVIVPIAIVYFLMQRRIVQGIALQGMKA